MRLRLGVAAREKFGQRFCRGLGVLDQRAESDLARYDKGPSLANSSGRKRNTPQKYLQPTATDATAGEGKIRPFSIVTI
jgi:hypothetical protein